MVLVDTSVWIRFLSSRTPFATELERLLNRNEVAGHDLIYGELLIGDPGGRRALLSDYCALHRLVPVPHSEVVTFVQFHTLYGRGIGWVDAHLLASARVAQVPIWTAGEGLAQLAEKLGVGYVPGKTLNSPRPPDRSRGGATGGSKQ